MTDDCRVNVDLWDDERREYRAWCDTHLTWQDTCHTS